MPVLTKINSNVIADDAITGDMLGSSAYLANTATQNISGTYSESRMYTSDAYTLSGNATINSNITLSTVKSTGDVVLTAGGAYTITGTGVLSAGSLVAPERSNLTGMIGELGSAVTGSPNLNLNNIGNTTTFPTGHVVQAVSKKQTTLDSGTETSWTNTGITMKITPKLANSYIHFMGTLFVAMTNSGGNGGCSFRWKRSQSGQTDAYPEELDDTNGAASAFSYASHWNQASWTAAEFNWMHPFQGFDRTTHTAGNEITYELQRVAYSLNGLVVGGQSYNGSSLFICYEIVKPPHH